MPAHRSGRADSGVGLRPLADWDCGPESRWGACLSVCLSVVLYNNNNNIYLLQMGCYPVAVVILHVNKT